MLLTMQLHYMYIHVANMQVLFKARLVMEHIGTIKLVIYMYLSLVLHCMYVTKPFCFQRAIKVSVSDYVLHVHAHVQPYLMYGSTVNAEIFVGTIFCGKVTPMKINP